MRIIITENQLNLLLLEESNKQKVIFGDYIKKGVYIAKKLISIGFSVDQASVIVGNMWAETTLDWTAGNSVDGPYGLLQWRGDRLKALKKNATHTGRKMSNIDTQLDFVKVELLNDYLHKGKFIPNLPKDIKNSPKYESNMFDNAMKADTIQSKAKQFALNVERCGKCGGSIPIRKKSAQVIHDFLTNKTTSVSTTNKTTSVSKKSIGDVIYPKNVSGGDNYVNVRKYADRESDKISTIKHPNKIGSIIKTFVDSKGLNWYKVKLTKPVSGIDSGWVRSDVVN
jgi:hypothetical protein